MKMERCLCAGKNGMADPGRRRVYRRAVRVFYCFRIQFLVCSIMRINRMRTLLTDMAVTMVI